MEFESLSRGWDHLGNIERTLGDLQGARTVIHELIQNADDAPGATRMRFVVRDDALEVWNDGVFERCGDVSSPDCEWLAKREHRCDFHSFRKMASGDKRNRPDTTGAFGIGFTAVYQLTDRPELFSNGEHWAVDEMAPEQDRIQRSRTPIDIEGTTFILPWAVEQSPLRKRIRQEPVSRAAIDTFIDELRTAIPGAMPFLKKLRVIEAVGDTQQVIYKLSKSGSHSKVTCSDGVQSEWLVLDGSFEEEAKRLKERSGGVVERARSPEVQLAIPIDGAPAGLLHATLPTEEPLHLPVLLNADFFPASDRKRIRFDNSPVSEWNRAAVRTAAQVLADNLEMTANAMGDKGFVRLLIAARDLHKRIEAERLDPAFGAFWDHIRPALEVACVVPRATGGHTTVDSVRLWVDPDEIAAACVIAEVDIQLVAEQVRADWFQLRGDIPISVLNLTDLAIALRESDLDRRWIPAERTDALSDNAGLGALWALLDFLLETRDRSTQHARDLLRDCAVTPGYDGAIWPVAQLYRTDPDTRQLLADVGVRTPFLDMERIHSTSPRLAQMVTDVTPTLVLDWVEEMFRDTDVNVAETTRLELLRWFFNHWSELDDYQCARLTEVPIFPTSSGPQKLTGLALPGDFKDELGLARLVAVEGIEVMRPFLRRLGAQRLTFASYCIDFVAEALEAGDLEEERRRRLLVLLATRLSEVKDDAEVASALKPLDLVPCTDGEWRPGTSVYLNRNVRDVVGGSVHYAAIPAERLTAHEDLFRWLGAADSPRPRDVEARCHELRSGAEGHRQAAEAVIQFVGSQFGSRREWVEAQYAGLKTIPWLPAEGDRGRGHAPHAVYTIFQRSLFASQAKFLDVSTGVQRANAAFLEWLGVESVPAPKQVVDHLLWSAEHNQLVREDMWIYLNQHATDPALDALVQRKCLLIAETSTYVRPSEVFWGWHPFGRYRHQLRPRFADYRDLLDRLGVAEEPAPCDAIEVLQDVAARHGGEQAPLLEDDVQVVQACWKLLSTGLDAETVEAGELMALANAEVVLDSRSWLSRPTDVFFRDSHSLAERFDSKVHGRLIDRPEGLWRAMAAAGVRNLSDAVESRIVEQQPGAPCGVVSELLIARRRLLLRVLAANDRDAARKLEAFYEDIQPRRLTNLVIQQAIEIDGRVQVSVAHPRGALFLPEPEEILYVEAAGSPPSWVEIAREVARALRIDGSRMATVAAAIKGVLAAADDGAALAEIDELGFPALDESSIGVAEPNIAGAFGGERVEEESDIAENAASLRGPRPNLEDDVATGEVKHSHNDTKAAVATGGSSPGNDDPPQADAVPQLESDPSVRGSAGGKRGSQTGPGRRPSQSSVTQTRLRSYVTPGKEGKDGDHDESDGDPEVERAGVDAVLEFERAQGRKPKEMPHYHPGFDIRSIDAEGKVRIIEVKSTADEWGARGVAISRAQFTAAQQRREDFWLYVVDRATTSPRVYAINDPATKIDQYFFDNGWQVAAEDLNPTDRSVPPLHLPDSSDGLERPVPYVDPPSGPTDTPSGWISCSVSPSNDTWFAVRIQGDSLGIAYRGGVAFVEPIECAVEDDELVLAILKAQIDPDTGNTTAIRRWHPERDLAGNQLALRLWSDSSIEPLTVLQPEDIDICPWPCRSIHSWPEKVPTPRVTFLASA